MMIRMTDDHDDDDDQNDNDDANDDDADDDDGERMMLMMMMVMMTIMTTMMLTMMTIMTTMMLRSAQAGQNYLQSHTMHHLQTVRTDGVRIDCWSRLFNTAWPFGQQVGDLAVRRHQTYVTFSSRNGRNGSGYLISPTVQRGCSLQYTKHASSV